MNITENQIIKDYKHLCSIAHHYYARKEFELASLFIKYASQLMYNSNLIYTDCDLEDLIFSIANNTIKKKNSKITNTNGKIRVVFYDYFVLDNRGLTEQYLEFFFDNTNYEVMFIGCNKDEKDSAIYSKLKNHKIQYHIIPDIKEISKSQIIYDYIESFSPEIIIAHTSPWDIAGLMSISLFENKCKRYLINITDHAFWLGTNVFDYFIEFRDYGYNISRYYRLIDENKLLKLPYYPIINTSIPFNGFDFDIEGKKLIFSGGSIYKIEGSTVFFEIVKHILVNHPDTIFLYLGSGNIDYIKKFIDMNGFQKRFFYRSERKDVFEIFKRCYFYLNTYPLSGGLMTQYACMAGKLPLTFRDAFDPESNLDELFISNPKVEIQFSNLESLKAKIDLYLDNPDVLQTDCKEINKIVINKTKFNTILHDYLIDSKNSFPVNDYSVDIKRFSLQYLKRFNDNKASYYKLFIKRNFVTFPFFFSYYIKFLFHLLKKK